MTDAEPSVVAPRYSIVVPTFNEAAGIADLIARIAAAMKGYSDLYEILIVDDRSPDGTADVIEALHRSDPHVRLIRRRGRPSRAGAVFDGLMQAQGRIRATMDSDGQHDPAILSELFRAIEGGADIAVGSRWKDYRRGGHRIHRRIVSRLGQRATYWAGMRLSDPTSEYYALDAELFRRIAPSLHPHGFRLFQQIWLQSAGARIEEISYTFGRRRKGQSKMRPRHLAEYAASLVRIAIRHRWPLLDAVVNRR